MKLRKLPVISEKQYEKLRVKGLDVGKKTTVEEVLKFFREDIDALAFDSRAPFFVKVHVAKSCMAEVMWFERKPYYGATSKMMGLYDTWDIAVSAALDYILKIESE